MKAIAIINSKPIFADNSAKDALDLALIFSSYEQKTGLFFHGDGVWQLMANQQPERVQQKNILKTFAAFEFYDIEDIYVCQQSLTMRGLEHNFHVENVKVLSTNEFAACIAQHAVVFRF